MTISTEIKSLIKIIRHKSQVSYLLGEIIRQLEKRADIHDDSKYLSDEFQGFCLLDIGQKHQKKEYGSSDYEDGIANIDAVKLHLSRNSHHPEYHSNGLSDMSFIDILEMLCDWEVARQERDAEKDIEKTWIVRQERFRLSDFEVYFLRTIWEKLGI